MPSQPRTNAPCTRSHRRIPHADWPHPQTYPHKLKRASRKAPGRALALRAARGRTESGSGSSCRPSPWHCPAHVFHHLLVEEKAGASSLLRTGNMCRFFALFSLASMYALISKSYPRALAVQLAIRRSSSAMPATGSSCSLLQRNIGWTQFNHTIGIQVPSQPAAGSSIKSSMTPIGLCPRVMGTQARPSSRPRNEGPLPEAATYTVTQTKYMSRYKDREQLTATTAHPGAPCARRASGRFRGNATDPAPRACPATPPRSV